MTSTASDSAEGHALFAPAEVAGLALQSRIVMAPMSRYFCPDGVPGRASAEYYARRAAGGVGLIISEGTYVPHPSAASYAGVPWFDERALPGWAGVLVAVHAAGARMFPQLWHTGSFRSRGMAPDPDLPGLGPSENTNAFTGHPDATRAMTTAEIDAVVAAYARAARDARELGFDGVEIHGGHGYLIDEFLWDRTNRRADRYGGPLRSRTRFATEVVAAIRDAAGPGFPISFRYSLWKQQDYHARLVDSPGELADLLGPLVEAGVTLLHCSTRRLEDPGFPETGPRSLAGWTRSVTGVPVIAVGGVGLDRPGLGSAGAVPPTPAFERFDRGEFDLLAVGRALIAEPDWTRLRRDGRGQSVAAFEKAMLDRLF